MKCTNILVTNEVYTKLYIKLLMMLGINIIHAETKHLMAHLILHADNESERGLAGENN